MRRPSDLPLWCFDLDDTLMWNAFMYNKPVWDFVQYLTTIFHNRIPSLGIIVRYHEKVDCALGKKINPRTKQPYAFCRERFLDSLVITYRMLCKNKFGTFDEAVAEECRKIGMLAFDETKYKEIGLVPGAEDVLSFLANQGKHRLVLVTKGDEYIQGAKIDALNLKRWFHDFHVVAQKNSAEYLGILSSLQCAERGEEYSPSDAIVVGNSYSSDIASALEAGMNTAFIPCATWKAESIEIDVLTEDERSRLVEFREISEIIPWYESLK